MELIDLRFSDEEFTTIEDLAACNYSPEKIALNLQVDKRAFLTKWAQKDSAIRQAYERGKMASEFTIINKQNELAKSGNITAAQVFLKEAERNDVNNIRNQVLFGDDY